MRIAVAAALIAAFVPAALAGPAVSPGVVRAKLADAIAEEQRAVALLKKKPPRKETAALALDRSAALLNEIRKSGGLGKQVSGRLDLAQYRDSSASDILTKPSGNSDPAGHAITFLISEALQAKEVAMELLRQPATAQGPQCADRKDNDRDGVVDARHDSGCANGKDATEQSPLTFRFEVTRDGLVATIEGATSGPISRIQITVPSGSPLDTKQPPQVGFTLGCRYASARQLDCLMKDGLANPRHRVDARLRFREGFASAFKVRVTDFAGRARTQTLTPPTGATADLRVQARIDNSFLGSNGVGSVGGTVIVTNLGPAESGPFRLLISSNRTDSARAASVTSLSCTQTQTGVSCTGPKVAKDLELAYAWSMPVSGAGLLTVRFEVQSDTADPQPANNAAEASVDLKPSP